MKVDPIYKVKTGQIAYVKFQHRRRGHFSTLKVDPIFFIYITFLDLAVINSEIAHILFQQRNKGGGVNFQRWKVNPPFYADEIAGKPIPNYLLLVNISNVNFHIRDQISTLRIDPDPAEM